MDRNNHTAAEYGIRGVPALFFFKGGRLVDRVMGAQSRTEIERRIRGLL